MKKKKEDIIIITLDSGTNIHYIGCIDELLFKINRFKFIKTSNGLAINVNKIVTLEVKK